MPGKALARSHFVDLNHLSGGARAKWLFVDINLRTLYDIYRTLNNQGFFIAHLGAHPKASPLTLKGKECISCWLRIRGSFFLNGYVGKILERIILLMVPVAINHI